MAKDRNQKKKFKDSTRHLPKDKILREAQEVIEGDATSELEKKAFDLPGLRGNERENVSKKCPYVVLRYFQHGWECFSHWEKDDLRKFSSFLETLSKQTWEQVYRSAGKGENKAGLGYTPYQRADMRGGATHMQTVEKLVSPDVTFFELRVSQRMRVHGFQCGAAFFLVLLDRQHRVFPD